MENINQRTWKQEWQSRRKNPLSFVLYLLVCGAALATFFFFFFIVGYILV